MESMSNAQMMQWLRTKMDAVEIEIRYLEEILCTTNGPANELINSLFLQKAMYKDYQTEYNRYYKKCQEEKLNDTTTESR